MELVFTDTSAFVALYNKKDQYHQEAIIKLNVLDLKPHTIITSSYIVDETLNHLLVKVGYKVSVSYGIKVFEQKADFLVVRIDEELEREAWQVFKKFNKDKIWSFTDCTSFALMKSMNIKTAFTFDKNFQQMGFKLL